MHTNYAYKLYYLLVYIKMKIIKNATFFATLNVVVLESISIIMIITRSLKYSEYVESWD